MANYKNNISYGNKDFSLVKYYFITLFNQLFYSILVIAAFSLMIISHNNKAFDIYWRGRIISTTKPIVKVIEYPTYIFYKSVLEVRDFVFAKRDNKKLKEKNKKLELLHKESLLVQKENQNLKEILNFVDAQNIYHFNTSKIYYTSRNSIINKIIIKSGLRDNLKEGSLVLGDKGSVLGRIVNVGDELSDVLLLTDINSKIPVVISGEENHKGILTGTGSGQPSILYISKNHHIQKGDLVYTSGDNDLIISGLFIGTISKVKQNYVKVKLFQNIKTIDDILIIDISEENQESISNTKPFI